MTCAIILLSNRCQSRHAEGTRELEADHPRTSTRRSSPPGQNRLPGSERNFWAAPASRPVRGYLAGWCSIVRPASAEEVETTESEHHLHRRMMCPQTPYGCRRQRPHMTGCALPTCLVDGGCQLLVNVAVDKNQRVPAVRPGGSRPAEPRAPMWAPCIEGTRTHGIQSDSFPGAAGLGAPSSPDSRAIPPVKGCRRMGRSSPHRDAQ